MSGVNEVMGCERHKLALVEVSYYVVVDCCRYDFGRKCIPEEEG